jgi:hypothetical protein
VARPERQVPGGDGGQGTAPLNSRFKKVRIGDDATKRGVNTLLMSGRVWLGSAVFAIDCKNLMAWEKAPRESQKIVHKTSSFLGRLHRNWFSLKK